MAQWTVEELLKKEPSELYEMVLDGRIVKFPKNFFMNRDNCIGITRYFIEEKLKWSEEEIYKKLCVKTFDNGKLKGLLRVYKGSPYSIINDAYPGKFHEWRFVKVPKEYWTEETACKATKWLIEEKLKWSEKEVYEKLCPKVFSDNGIRTLLQVLYGDNVYKVLEVAYPGKYKPWIFGKVPNGYWTEENAASATKWLVEEGLKWSKEDVYKYLDTNMFYVFGLGGMIHRLYGGNVYKALEVAYPGIYKSWFFEKVPNGYWNKATAIEATKWLIEEKLKWSEEEIYKNISLDIFKENNLLPMLYKVYNGSMYSAFEAAYPGKYSKSKLRRNNK